MAKRNAVLNIIFGADTKELDKALQGVAKRLRSTADDLTGLGKSLSVGLTAPIVAFGALATKNAVDSAKAIAQVEAAVKSTGGAAGKSVSELEAMAEGLQRVSLFDDDEILKDVTANMLTFTKITGKEFDRAQQATLDLATRLGTDLTSATVQVGKALNDPIKGVTALGRAGVQFTAQQKEQIEAMVEAGDVAGAQNIILGELETQFGGAAKAAADADPYTQLANEIGNLSEDFGKLINDFLKPLLVVVRRAVDAIKGWSDSTKATVLVVAGLLAVLGPTLIAVGSLINAYTTIKGALLTAKTAQLGLNTSILANPYVAAAAAVGVLIGAMVLYKSEADKARQAKEDFDRVIAGKQGREALQLIDEQLADNNEQWRENYRLVQANAKAVATWTDAGKEVPQDVQRGTDALNALDKQLRDNIASLTRQRQIAVQQQVQGQKDAETLRRLTEKQDENTESIDTNVQSLIKATSESKTYEDTLEDRLLDIDAEYKVTGDLNTRIEQTADAYRNAAIAAQRLGNVERSKELKALMQGQGTVAGLTPVGAGQIANPALQDRGLMFDPANARRTEEARAFAEHLEEIDNIMKNLGSDMKVVGDQFGESLGMLITGAEGAEEALKGTARAAIDAAFNAATALAIQAAGQTAVGSGPAAAIVLPALITAGMGLIKSVFSNLVGLATGGLTTGPMLAMIGDNPSGKEAVIPFERMGEFLQMAGAGQSQNVVVTGRISGNDILLTNDRASRDRSRIRGY
jgi:hypothetical protein